MPEQKSRHFTSDTFKFIFGFRIVIFSLKILELMQSGSVDICPGLHDIALCYLIKPTFLHTTLSYVLHNYLLPQWGVIKPRNAKNDIACIHWFSKWLIAYFVSSRHLGQGRLLVFWWYTWNKVHNAMWKKQQHLIYFIRWNCQIVFFMDGRH